MLRKYFNYAILGCALTAVVPTLGAQDHLGQYSQAEKEMGARLYAAHCSACHGITGDSIAGVDLGSNRFRRAASDEDLAKIIVEGIAATAMPPHTFSAPELRGVIAYVRTMRDFEATAIKLGDPTRGQAVFEGKGQCTSCHRVNGRGSRRGPDLSAIGTVRTIGALRRVLVTPDEWKVPAHRAVRLVTSEGKVITGRHLNEDTHTIQLMDSTDHLVSLEKSSLREYRSDADFVMPAYDGVLTPDELADVLAYLVSLKE